MTQDPDYTLDAGLPANVDAERTILGAILLDNEAFFDDSMELTPDDFSLDSHRRIYLRMNDILFGMVEGATHVDIVTLANELNRRKEIEAVGGVAYLASLTEGLPRRPVISDYVLIVKDKARLRRLMGICSATIAKAADQSKESSQVIEEHQTNIFELAGDGMNTAVPIGSVTPAVEERIRNARNVSQERTALELTWGLKGLDEFTHGMYKGEFTIIGGETNGGKTPFGMQVVLENALEGTPCAIFSMEMTKEKVGQRFYPLISEIITADQIRDPRLMNLHTHIPEMERVSRVMAGLPIQIDDSSPLRIDKLIARMRMMRRKFKTELFLIDYMQLIEGMPKMNETSAFKGVVFALRDFVKVEPGCHLIVLSQYSKADGFTKKKTRTRDSLYGGSIIQHAAQNIFMITLEDSEKRDRLDLLDVEIKIAKYRDGRRSKVTCSFDQDHLKFCYPQPVLKGA